MSRRFKIIQGSLTAPEGFRAGAIGCGIKNPEKKRLDLAIITSDEPAVTAASFTTNKIKAAPVKVSQCHMRTNGIRAVIVNSGNANACTGSSGIADAKLMARSAGAGLGLKGEQVLVCSTGIIGVPMPMARITTKIPKLVKKLNASGGDKVAKAILTSDTCEKKIAIEFAPGRTPIRIGAVCKGAGMICPSMATMLCFITTDVRIEKSELNKATQAAVDRSFNRISVDGDMSTNDTVIVMANGAAKNRIIKSGTPAAAAFREALEFVMLKMAKAIVRDGERVTKFVDVQVRGARTYLDARKVAEAVSKSLLVKSSWNGEDPNWGRVIHAVGYARATIKEELIDIYFGGLAAAKNGVAAETPLPRLKKIVEKPEFTLTIDLNLGSADHHVYTSDISPEYVDFNRSEYSALNVAP